MKKLFAVLFLPIIIFVILIFNDFNNFVPKYESVAKKNYAIKYISNASKLFTRYYNYKGKNYYMDMFSRLYQISNIDDEISFVRLDFHHNLKGEIFSFRIKDKLVFVNVGTSRKENILNFYQFNFESETKTLKKDIIFHEYLRTNPKSGEEKYYSLYDSVKLYNNNIYFYAKDSNSNNIVGRFNGDKLEYFKIDNSVHTEFLTNYFRKDYESLPIYFDLNKEKPFILDFKNKKISYIDKNKIINSFYKKDIEKNLKKAKKSLKLHSKRLVLFDSFALIFGRDNLSNAKVFKYDYNGKIDKIQTDQDISTYLSHRFLVSFDNKIITSNYIKDYPEDSKIYKKYALYNQKISNEEKDIKEVEKKVNFVKKLNYFYTTSAIVMILNLVIYVVFLVNIKRWI